VNTTWRVLSTDLPIACWASSTRESKKRSHRRQSLPPLLLPLQPQRKPSLCRPHGHFGQPGGMMVRTSMRVLHVVSMHGWAKWHRTTHCNSPLPTPPSNDHFQPCYITIPREQALLHAHVVVICKMAAWRLQDWACSMRQKAVKQYKCITM
jgi:hypothetical protein